MNEKNSTIGVDVSSYQADIDMDKLKEQNIAFIYIKATEGATDCIVTLERTFDDVTLQGEIEGLTFDHATKQLLLLYNRGARIVLGMPKGFYDGYDKEISEVFVYDMTERSY